MARRILIADDDPAVLRALSAAVRDLMGLEAELASDASGARRALGLARFDAILTDIVMPGDGRTVLQEAQRACPGTPVIMMTALVDRYGREQVRAWGAFELLAKPFEPAELEAVLTRAFARHDAGGGAGA